MVYELLLAEKTENCHDLLFHQMLILLMSTGEGFFWEDTLLIACSYLVLAQDLGYYNENESVIHSDETSFSNIH